MKYLDYTTYKDYGGELGEDVFNSLIGITEDIIDMATYNRINNVETLPVNVRNNLSKATFYQLEYINNTDGMNSILGDEREKEIKSESIGSYSVTFKENEYTGYRLANIKLNALASNELDKSYLRNNWIRRCRY